MESIPPIIILHNVRIFINLRKFDFPVNISLAETNKIIIKVKNIKIFFKSVENSMT
ncbi:hypothetical protein [Clostridium sp.]|uniref:hypothetical protein n=1 Tax=Clostridium sp. TaxID=1506 RepID=UPI00351F903A